MTSVTRSEERNVAVVWAHAAVDALAQSGLRDVFVSPGSRSTPLVAAGVEDPRIRTHSVIDERSAAFCALGTAQASDRPVALVCTSGTATANYLPALCEADLARVPLVVLTADRPPMLRESGSSQSMRQVGLYGDHVRWSHDLAMPAVDAEALAYVRSIARRAYAIASELAGPVHLNFPFAKPLEPMPGSPAASGPVWSGPERVDGRGGVYQPTHRVPSPVAVTDVVRRLEHATRPAILVGSSRDGAQFAAVLAEVAERVGAPIIAEATSQLRFGPLHDSIVAGDVILSNPELAGTLRPDFVIRLGLPPLNWPVKNWYEGLHAQRVVIHPRRDVDPQHDADIYFPCDASPFLEALRKRLPVRPRPSAWRDEFMSHGRRAASWTVERMHDAPLVDASVAHHLVMALPAGASLVVSSSMPLRELETFAVGRPDPLRIFCNRGLNGIDGVVSTAFGVALATEEPTALLIGDVAATHDLGAFQLAAGLAANLTIVIVDNGGGAIFDHLPVAGMEPMFSRHFVTEPQIDWRGLQHLFGCSVTRITSTDRLPEVLRESFSRTGVDVVVVETDRLESKSFRTSLLASFPSQE